jgi:prepilin-type N-terminal cleavage/methylation domain-containing protein
MRNKGFTLIELLVVIAIIGILSSVVLASLNSARSKSRDAKRMSDVKQIQLALELYYDQNGSYPTSPGCSGSSPNSSWCNSVENLSGGRWIDNGSEDLSLYLSTDPLDPLQGASPNWTPLNGGTIFYFADGYGGAGQWYMIVFGLENYPHSIEDEDGVTACDSTYFHYGSGSNGIITFGGSC